LIDRWSAYRGKETDVEHNASICVGCSIGCGIDVETRNNSLVRIEGDWEAEVNDGILCEIGRFHPVDENRERINTPMVRKEGKLVPASWDEALDTLTAKIKPLVGKEGDGIAAVVSNRLPAEAIYAFKQIFKDGFKSDMVTSMEEGIFTELPTRLAAELGKPFEGKIDCLKNSDCVIVIGADLIKDHQVVGFFIKRALPEGAKMVVVDPNENPLDHLTNSTLKANKGADLDWVKCLSAAVVKTGLAKVVSSLDADAVLKAAEDTTGVTEQEYLELAQLIASAERPAIVYGKGITEKNSTQTLKALVELGELIGAIGEDFSNIVSTKGDANSMAAAQYQLESPFQLNAHQAVFVALGDEKPSKRFELKLEKAPFLAVQASFVSPLTAQADVVLPVTMWTEQEGHYLNLDGRIQKAVKALEPAEDTWTNVKVLDAIAERLGFETDDNWKAELTKRVSPVAIQG